VSGETRAQLKWRIADLERENAKLRRALRLSSDKEYLSHVASTTQCNERASTAAYET